MSDLRERVLKMFETDEGWHTLEGMADRILPLVEAIKVEIESTDSQNGRDMLSAALAHFMGGNDGTRSEL